MRWAVPQVVRIGAGLSLLGGVSQLLLWLGGVHTVWALALPQCIYMLGHGFHQPCGQGGAVAPFPRHAGRAAALSGCVITGAAFISGQLVSVSSLPASYTLVIAMSIISALVGLVALIAIPRAYRGASL